MRRTSPWRSVRLGVVASVAFLGLVSYGHSQETGTPAGAGARSSPEDLNFAHGLLRQRRFELAAEEYQKYLDTGPAEREANEARFGLANARLFQGRYRDARTAFGEFLERAPRHPRARVARYRLGELGYLLGDLPGARKALESFTADPSDHPNLETAWTYLGDVCFGLNDLEAARSAYARSLERFPGGPMADRARLGLGRSLAGLGKTDEALSTLTNLAKSGRADWSDKAWLQVGLVQFAAGRDAEAIRAFEALERERPRSALVIEARIHRAEALARLGRGDEALGLIEPIAADPSRPLAADASLLAATIRIQRGEAEAALAGLEDALRKFPKSPLTPALAFRSAEALRKLGRGREAVERFVKMAGDSPSDPWADDAILRATQLEMEAGRAEAALGLASTFPTRFPRSGLRPEMELIRARAERASGKTADGIARLEALLGIKAEGQGVGPGKPGSLAPALTDSARYELALAYRDGGQAARADALLTELAAPGRGPIAADALFLIGQSHLDAGRFTQAVEALERYLKADPPPELADYALAHLSAGQVGLNRSEPARKTLDELARRYPRSEALPAARLRLAEAELKANQPARAAELFRLILADEPDADGPASAPKAATNRRLRPRARVGLGRALWSLGKSEEAAATFEEWLKESKDDPSAPEIALARGRALEAAGKFPAALEAFARVAHDHPRSAPAALAELAGARLLARTGKPAEAAASLATLTTDPARSRALAAAGEPADALLAERGWALVDAGKTADADAVFKDLLKAFPDSPHAIDARFNLAESANQARDHKEVVRLLSPAASASVPDPKVKDSPKAAGLGTPGKLMPAILLRLGRSQVELGQWEAARSTLDRLLAGYPEDPHRHEARFLRAEVALATNDAVRAEPLFAALEAEPATPDDPSGLAILAASRRAQCLLALKRWKDALGHADALLAKLPRTDPLRPELGYARGRALFGLGRLNEARSALQAVIGDRKGSEVAAQAQLLIAESYFHEGTPASLRSAEREYWRAYLNYEMPRWRAAALLQVGKVCERLDRWSEAAEAYEQLCTDFPDGPLTTEARTRQAEARKRALSRGNDAPRVF